jgi:hexosaminidase
MKPSPSLLITCLLLCVRTTAATGVEVKPTNDLMPEPAAMQFQAGRLPITKDFAVATSRYVDDRLRRAIGRATHRLEARTGIEFVKPPTGAANLNVLIIEVERSGDLVPSVNEVETYTLQVTSQQALLKADTVVGALRGLETLLQLVTADRDGYFLPAVSIQDQRASGGAGY